MSGQIERKLCACGCGNFFEVTEANKMRKFLDNHRQRGRSLQANITVITTILVNGEEVDLTDRGVLKLIHNAIGAKV